VPAICFTRFGAGRARGFDFEGTGDYGHFSAGRPLSMVSPSGRAPFTREFRGVLAAVEGASNLLIDIEELSDDDLDVLHERFRKLVEHARTLGMRGVPTASTPLTQRCPPTPRPLGRVRWAGLRGW
jgi:hypothetical protein